jgi:hypothetical protein
MVMVVVVVVVVDGIYCRPARRALGLDGRDGSMLIIDVD